MDRGEAADASRFCGLFAGECTAWAWPAPGADGPANPGAIAGHLVNVEGRPVAGGSVWGVSQNQEVGRALADDQGRFRLGPLGEDQPVNVWFEGGGLARERREGVHVFGGRDLDLGALAMVPGTRIVGRVVDLQGRPIAGAEVSVDVYRRVLGHTIASNQARWELSADADGRFRTASLPAGEAELVIGSAGKVRVHRSRRAIPGTGEADLGDVRLEDEVPIRGVVVNQDGKPAAGVQVIADYEYENAATTDASGRFAVGGTGKDIKELLLRSNDYFATKPFPIGPDRANLRLEVRRAYTIVGSAVNAETAPR